MQVERVRPTEETILEALACYRFLTPEQMLRLGVTPSKAHLYATLRTLADRKPSLLTELDFGALPSFGRLPRLYTLTPRGAELLNSRLETENEVDASKQITLFNRDYFHRVACVEFHLALRAWAEANGVTVDFYHAYYDPVPGTPRGGRPAPKTRIKLTRGSLVPDATFAITDSGGVQRLYTFEMYNGRYTERVVGQLETYLSALAERAIRKAYRYEHAERVLVVFDTEENLRLVTQRLSGAPNFVQAQRHFFLAAHAVMRARFFDGWQRFDGAPTTLY